MSEAYCLKCEKTFTGAECADACAIAELYQTKPIIKCKKCGTKNRIYVVIEYRVLRMEE